MDHVADGFAAGRFVRRDDIGRFEEFGITRRDLGPR